MATTLKEQLALVNAMSAANAASSDDGMAAQRQPSAPDNGLTGAIHSPEGLASLARGLGQAYGPLHEKAVRIAWGLDSADGASPEVMQRLADIRAGKYNTMNGPHPLMKLGFAAIMGGGALSALGAGAGVAGSASAGGTAAASGGGGLASGLASFLGPATGTIQAAPVIGAAGAPTVSALLPAAGTAAAGGASAGGTALSSPSWLESLLSETGEAGVSAASLEGGFNSASGTSLWDSLTPEGGWMKGLGRGLPGLVGALAHNKQADAYGDLAKQYLAYGAPSRARYEASFAPGFDIGSLPGVQNAMDVSTDTLLRRLSAQSGNPFGDPGGLAEAMKYVSGNVALPQLNEYRRLNAGAGGMAALTSAAPGASAASLGHEGNVFNAFGQATSNVMNPPKSLAQLLKELREFA